MKKKGFYGTIIRQRTEGKKQEERLCFPYRISKEDVYPAVYRRGKELYETGGVLDFAYDIYLEHDLPVAEVRAEVRGREQSSYRVTVVVDEEYGSVSSSNCTCEGIL